MVLKINPAARHAAAGLLLVGLMMIDTPATAGIIVNWGGDYVSQTQSLQGSETSGNGSDTYTDPVKLPYSPSTNLYSPPSIAGLPPKRSTAPGEQDTEQVYSPKNDPAPNTYSGVSDRFYGGHVVVLDTTALNNTGMSKLQVENQGGNDAIDVDVNPASELRRFAMLTYWKKEDFLTGGGSSETYKLQTGSTISVTSTQDSQAKNATGHFLRWVIQNGDNFYLSTSVPFPTAFANNLTYSANLWNITSWAGYDPLSASVTSLDSLFGGTTEYSTGQANFSDIRAVGFYVEYDRASDPKAGNGAGAVHYKISGFKATNSVPEPSTFLLGLAGFGGVALKRWRKRRESGGTDAPLLTEATT